MKQHGCTGMKNQKHRGEDLPTKADMEKKRKNPRYDESEDF
ncbi:hypothetical protein [Paenibacillus selenitireducens]|nr:hypothetical protein [Paenibacillus selenitireducens]